MINIQVKMLTGGPDYKIFNKKVPEIPHVGDYLSSSKDGFSGYVKDKAFWWNEKGQLFIEVTIQ